MDITALQFAATAFKSALQKQDRQAVLAAAERLIELKAPLGQQWQGLAQEVSRWGELNLALRALDVWSSQGSAGPYAGYQKATLLARVGKAEEAERELAALPADAPTPVANAYLKGALATNLGNSREAERHFRRALKAAPDSGRAWLGLVQLGCTSERDEADLRRNARAVARAATEDRAAFAIALGLLEHAKDNYERAFAHYRDANDIERERYSYDVRDNEASAAIASSWAAADIANLAGQVAAPDRRPIFVTGLARSGTTLVEQILASHSAVDAGGELGLALQMEAIVGGFAPSDFRKYLASGGSLDLLQATFLRLVAERVPGTGVFVDKSLNMSRALGPLSALFPDSPIVWMRRDPVENALSIYRTWLANNVVGGWRLEELAHHMRLEDALLDHWTHQLRDRLLVVQYEELVEDPPGWTERITRHCGLEVEEQQFASHRTARAVATASALQVREPINRRGIGAAEPYRPFLKRFIDAYGA